MTLDKTNYCLLCAAGNKPVWHAGLLSHYIHGAGYWVNCLGGNLDITQDQLAARKMRILQESPPNIDRITEVLPMARHPSVIFCYGDTIYSPSGSPLPAWIVEHEKVHSIRQGDNAASIEMWWEEYLHNKEFRYNEELPAHIVEFATFKSLVKGDSKRKQALRQIAQRLAGPLYSVGTTSAVARHAILEGKQNV